MQLGMNRVTSPSFSALLNCISADCVIAGSSSPTTEGKYRFVCFHPIEFFYTSVTCQPIKYHHPHLVKAMVDVSQTQALLYRTNYEPTCTVMQENGWRLRIC